MQTNPAAAVGFEMLPVQCALGAMSMCELSNAVGAMSGNVVLIAIGLSALAPFWKRPPMMPISVLPLANVPWLVTVSAVVALSALVACVAVSALVACVALVAFVALVALTAFAALFAVLACLTLSEGAIFLTSFLSAFASLWCFVSMTLLAA
jgi:hypothetical protein